MSPVEARARRHGFADLGLANVLPVRKLARVTVNRLVDVLVDGLRNIDELTGSTVELPEKAVLADREQQLLIVDVDQHTLVDVIQVECLARLMLEVPLHPTGERIQRQRRVRVQRVVVRRHASTGRNPRFGLGRADIIQTEFRVEAAGNPGVASGTQAQRHLTPRGVVGVAGKRDGRRAPQFRTRGRIVPRDEAGFIFVTLAPVDAAHDDAIRDDRATHVREALGVVGFNRPPRLCTRARVEGDERRVEGRQKDLVLI